LLEEVFALTYCVPGMTVADIEKMTVRDREWYYKRLQDQKKSELDALKG
jgi:hypothetical protein